MTVLVLLANQGPPYHKELLKAAEKFRDDGHYGISIITAHIACEIRAEKVMTLGLRLRGFVDTDEVAAILNLRGSNIATDKNVGKLYSVLTGDRIQDQPFWSTFVESRRLRNSAVHSDKKNTRDEANTACEVARQLLRHLESVIKRLKDEARAKAKSTVGA